MKWSIKITLLYVGFIALIVTLVASSMRQKIDVVSKDYYEQELQYQHTIDASKNQAALSAPASVWATNTEVHINFPKEFADKPVSTKIHFYSPVNDGFDRNFSLSTDNRELSIKREQLANTRYKIKISWNCNGVSYYQESEINLKS